MDRPSLLRHSASIPPPPCIDWTVHSTQFDAFTDQGCVSFYEWAANTLISWRFTIEHYYSSLLPAFGLLTLNLGINYFFA